VALEDVQAEPGRGLEAKRAGKAMTVMHWNAPSPQHNQTVHILTPCMEVIIRRAAASCWLDVEVVPLAEHVTEGVAGVLVETVSMHLCHSFRNVEVSYVMCASSS
jgi:hypothetical protein